MTRNSIMASQRSATGTMVLILSLLAAMSYGTAACTTQDRNALLTFKAAISADPIEWLSGWVADGDCCSWYGISCNSAGHVTALDLRPDPASDDNTQYLQGTLSPALSQLTYLQKLDLSNMKRLSGALPASFGYLKNLNYLDVRNNKLSGSIPASYGGLTKLTWLSLGDNMISGSIPKQIGNIGTSLKYLYCGGLSLSGSIPTELYKLTGLEDFYLNDNSLSGGISPLVENLDALTNLDFSGNKLTGSIPTEIGSLSNLGFWDLSHNELSGGLPLSVGNLKKLYHLTLNNNKLSGKIPSVYGSNLKNLIALDLSYNELTGPIPQVAPFDTFPASSFTHNAGLCGKPLTACKRKLLR